MTKAEMSKTYDLEDRTLAFAKSVRLFVKKLHKSVANIEDSKQLIRDSGSIGANYIEANESQIEEYKQKLGAESIVLGYGTGRDNEAFIYRFANLLGTPNVLTAGHMCYGPRVATSIITCGNLPVCDYEKNPQCIMVWGNNAIISNPDEYKGVYLSDALAKGAKLIVVDPRFTKLADRSNLWLQLRPGTDVALALGMIHVILEEGLYDKEFVQHWVHGWREFVDRVQEYPQPPRRRGSR